MNELHFWNLKSTFCVKLKEVYRKKLFRTLLNKLPLYKISKLTKIDESILREFKNKKDKKIEINTLIKLMKFANIGLEDIEKYIEWIGPHTDRGIFDPKLPFQLNNSEFVRILAASFGDGTITNRSGNSVKYKLGVFEYSNEESLLRKQLISCGMKVFGGKKEEYLEMPNRNTFYLKFSSIIRDVILLRESVQGKKSIFNPNVPNIVMKSKNPKMWIEWLKQSFDDEDSVRFRDNYNHEVYLTRVMDITESLKEIDLEKRTSIGKLSEKIRQIVNSNPVKLLVDEKILLNKLGISSVLRSQEVYITREGRIKVKWRLYITRKDNIRRFSEIVGFSTVKKLSVLNKIRGDITEINPQDKRNTMGSEVGRFYQKTMGKRETIQIQC